MTHPYLKLLAEQGITRSGKDGSITPIDQANYASHLESLKTDFLGEVIKEDEDTIREYIRILKSIKTTIMDIGLISVASDDIITMITNGLSEGTVFLQEQLMMTTTISSIEKTIQFLSTKGKRQESAPTEEKPLAISPQSDWMSLDEVCHEFRLPRNSIKSKAWRDKNKFPYRQDGPCGRVAYNRKDIAQWIAQNQKC